MIKQDDKRVVKYCKKVSPNEYWIVYHAANGDFEAENEKSQRTLLSNFGIWHEIRKHLHLKPWPIQTVWDAIDLEIKLDGYDHMAVLQGTYAAARTLVSVHGKKVGYAGDVSFADYGSDVGCIPKADQWKKEGKCPQCGELGPFIHCQATCSTHGPY